MHSPGSSGEQSEHPSGLEASSLEQASRLNINKIVETRRNVFMPADMAIPVPRNGSLKLPILRQVAGPGPLQRCVASATQPPWARAQLDTRCSSSLARISAGIGALVWL